MAKSCAIQIKSFGCIKNSVAAIKTATLKKSNFWGSPQKCGAFCVAWFIGMRLRALASCTGESRILALSKRGADQAVVGKIAKPQHDERRKYRACQIGCISAKYITQRIDACKQR